MKLYSKRAFKRIAVGLVVLIGAALVVNGVLAWRAQSRLDTMVAELRAAGEPASLADLAPKPVPPDENAAAHLARMAADLKAFAKDKVKFEESQPGEIWTAKLENGERPTEEQLQAVRAILEKYPALLPGLEKAASCESYASLADFTLPPSQFLEKCIGAETMGLIRTLERYAVWKMAVLIAEGNSDEAARLGLQLLRLARLYDHEPLLVNYLVSIAVRERAIEMLNFVLRRNSVPPQVRGDLDAELAAQDIRKAMSNALRTERAFTIPDTVEQTMPVPGFLRWPMLNFFLGELEVEKKACEFAQLQMDANVPLWDQTQPAMAAAVPKTSLIGPAILGSAWAEVRCLARARCLRVLNALEKYRDTNGKDATNVEQLSLPAGVAIDPFSGKPLLLKKVDDGWVVYSVGMNGVDDGGDFRNMKDVGLGPPAYSHQ